MLTPGETAKLDHFQTQASAIVRRLTFGESPSIDMERGAIDALQNLYNAYPDPVKKSIRADVLPRVPFELVTGWVKCPHCVKGMVSPDEDHTIPKLDASGKQVFEDITEPETDGNGSVVLDDAGQMIWKVVGQKPVMMPIAHEKRTCPVCGGAGELQSDKPEPVEMTAAEIEAKFGVRVK